MKKSALAAAAAVVLLGSPAHAGKIVIGCTMIKEYSDFEVNMMIGRVRSAVGEQEAGKLYNKYVSLKNECRGNASASRTVAVSPALNAWLVENGVNVEKIVVSKR